jgi:hypothetical protein
MSILLSTYLYYIDFVHFIHPLDVEKAGSIFVIVDGFKEVPMVGLPSESPPKASSPFRGGPKKNLMLLKRRMS